MRLKATWIIPGLLLTLLLGLLWAIPAFAASAGTISFKDGSDTISYVSLEGVGSSGNAISVTVTDSDLDTVLKRTPANNNLFCIENTDETYVECPELGTFDADPSFVAPDDFDNDVDLGNAPDEDWHYLQDMSGDNRVNNMDIKGYTIEVVDTDDEQAPDGDTTSWTVRATEVTTVDFDYDRGNGDLQVDSGTVNAIGYHIKKQTVIGARNGTNRPVMITRDATTDGVTPGADATHAVGDSAVETELSPPTAAPIDTSLVDTDGSLTWGELLSSKIPDVMTRDIYAAADDNASRTIETELEAEIAAALTAYNDGDKENKLSISVAATLQNAATAGTAQDDPVPGSLGTGGITVTISNTDTGTDIDENTVCLGNIRNDEDLATGDTLACSGTTYYTAADVILEVPYVGSAATVYPGTGRIGAESEVNRVTVDTNAMANPISVILQETGAASGAFSAMLEICDSDDEGCMEATQGDEASAGEVDADASRTIMVPVDNEGDSIVVRYKDADPGATRSATIALDATGPAFSDMSPASGTSGREDEPTVSFQVNDAESGLSSKDTDTNTIRVIAAIYDLGNTSLGDSEEYLRNVLNPKAANNGYMTSFTLEEGSGAGELDAKSLNEYEIHWWAIAMDEAGNTSVSDQNSATKCTLPGTISASTLSATVKDMGTDDKDDDVGCEPHKIRVDSAAPEMTDATTGVYMDGDKEKTGKATSVVARFNEALDCDTVSADDFTVGGSAANGATCSGKNVYLDVDELASDATPKVVVATGSVSDKAGNAIAGNDASRTETASDGLAPNLTVTVTGTGTGDRPVTKGKITVAVTSDERLTGRPDVQIHKVGTDYMLTGDDEGGDADPTGTTNEYSSSWTIDGGAGVYNVYVTGEDRSADSGTGSKGMMALGSADKFKDSKTILFEVDTGVAAPDFAPANNGSTDNPNVFITVNFADEGNEYPIKDTKGNDDEKDDVMVDVDTHGTVTVTSAMFNGEAVEMNTRDNMLFTYRPGNLSLGDHKLELEVTDNAGNEAKGTSKLSLSFTVKERAAWVLKLHAGTNLVSIPANPTDGDIDTVFGDEAITRVVTRDNATGLWMVASKGSDGSFAGDLDTIDAGHGYWVVSDAPVDVMIDLPPSGGVTVLPPAIKVSEGWNLVPIANPAQEKDGFEIAAKTYFANIKADVAYGYDSLTGTMTRIDASSGSEDNVMVGSGYWVYANEAGVIIP